MYCRQQHIGALPLTNRCYQQRYKDKNSLCLTQIHSLADGCYKKTG